MKRFSLSLCCAVGARASKFFHTQLGDCAVGARASKFFHAQHGGATTTSRAAKTVLLSLITVIALCSPLFAEDQPFSPDKLFVEGTSAYDEGRYADAVSAYERILKEDLGAGPVFYNLGNAYFKSGDFPRAILYYLRAKTLTPRDHELAANLDFALQQVNAPRETHPLWHTAAHLLSRSEWERIATLAYWLCAASLLLLLLCPRLRGPEVRAAVGFGVAALVCLPPMFIWAHTETHPAVVVLSDCPARYAPLDNAAVHYETPKGTVATLTDQNGEWLKIRTDGKDGWVLKTSAQSVYPLDAVPPPP